MRYTRTMPAEGTFRYAKNFAFLPTTITTKNADGRKVKTTIWLEYYKTEYHYCYGDWSELCHRRELL